MRINDGMDVIRVNEINKDTIELIADRDGKIHRGKGLHIDGFSYRPAAKSLSKRDHDLIDLAKEIKIEYLGLSFVYSLEDIEYVSDEEMNEILQDKTFIKNINNSLQDIKNGDYDIIG